MADRQNIPNLKTFIGQYFNDNTTNDITADDGRQAFFDTIDTLNGFIEDLGEGRCESETIVFNNPTKDINFDSELKICGNKGTFTAKVNFKDVSNASEISDPLAIIASSDFPDFKWLKPVRYYHVIDNASQIGILEVFNSKNSIHTKRVNQLKTIKETRQKKRYYI